MTTLFVILSEVSRSPEFAKEKKLSTSFAGVSTHADFILHPSSLILFP
jgi:hypothetical protein